MLASRPTDRPVMSPMRSSKWSAHGNEYLLVEDERLTPDRARELSSAHDTDGILEVLSADGPVAAIAIWNPDGSRAELSGNGTRIAARWLAERAGTDEVRVRVGERQVLPQASGKLGREADLHWTSVGQLVVECHSHAVPMLHLAAPLKSAARIASISSTRCSALLSEKGMGGLILTTL